MADHEDDDDLAPASGMPAWILPIATSGMALAIGVGVGALGTWLVTRGEPEVVEVPRELTSAELADACAPFIAVASSDLEEAQEKVAVLRADVAQKEARVKDLESEIERRNERGKAFVEEFNRLKAELAEAKTLLEQAEREKAALVQELATTVAQLEQTEEALEKQTELTEIARDDALANKWSSFVNDAQLEICEKGNRKGLGKCRETVLASLDAAMSDRFEHCIRAGQEAPTLRELVKGETLPAYGRPLGEDDKRTRDWYVSLCDPTLPEADSLDDLPGLKGGSAAPGWDLGD
jgi:hypothetical protein